MLWFSKFTANKSLCTLLPLRPYLPLYSLFLYIFHCSNFFLDHITFSHSVSFATSSFSLGLRFQVSALIIVRQHEIVFTGPQDWVMMILIHCRFDDARSRNTHLLKTNLHICTTAALPPPHTSFLLLFSFLLFFYIPLMDSLLRPFLPPYMCILHNFEMETYKERTWNLKRQSKYWRAVVDDASAECIGPMRALRSPWPCSN